MDGLLTYNIVLKIVVVLIEIVSVYYFYRMFYRNSYITPSKVVIGGAILYIGSSILEVFDSVFYYSLSVNRFVSVQVTMEFIGGSFLCIGIYFFIKRMICASNIDYLTHTYTKRYIDKMLSNEKRICDKKDGYFSIVFIDINNFKQVNDRFGHEEGNQVLKEIALTLKESVRNDDKIARYGGDEFIILLHNTNQKGAFRVLERCRQSILENKSFQEYSIGISGGMATYPYDGKTVEDICRIADKRMYKEKEDTIQIQHVLS